MRDEMMELRVTIPADMHAQIMKMAQETSRTPDDVVVEMLALKLTSKHQKTVGKVAETAIRQGLPNKEALRLVREAFPTADTTPASIAWYRANLRRRGENVPTDQEARAAQR